MHCVEPNLLCFTVINKDNVFKGPEQKAEASHKLYK